jgi:UDP-galactopyranose mutase
MSIVILGGGLAGLSAALNLPDYLDVTLFEKEATLGGLLRTDTIQGHHFDFGPHLYFHTDPYFTKIFQTALKDVGYITKPAKTGQWSFKQLVEFPYNLHLFKLPRDIVTDCVVDFATQQLAIARGTVFNSRNYEEYCRNYFGNGFTDHFMIPYARKIWTVHPRELTTEWTGSRVILPELPEVIRGALTNRSLAVNYIKEFRYPRKGGSQSIANGLSSLIRRKIKVELGVHVVEINLYNQTIKLSNGTSCKYEHVISTLPLPDLLRLVVDLPKDVRNAIEKLRWIGILLMNFVSRNLVSNEFQWIYFDQQDACFHRIHYPCKLTADMEHHDICSLQAEISFSKHRELPATPDNLLERAWQELKDQGFVAGNASPIVATARILEYAYAIMDHDRLYAINFIHNYLKKKHYYSCGRFGEWDYFWTDKVLFSGKRAAQEVLRHI